MTNPKLLEIATELENGKYETSGSIYHPIPFPEFANVKTSSKPQSAEAKWSLIRSTFSDDVAFEKLNVLDVGSNIGFYTFNFAKLGATVNAYEPHSHYVDYGQRINEAAGLNSNWHNKILEAEDIQNKQFDVALMLSVFQWMSEGDKYLDEATELFRLIAKNSQTLFFELGCNHGKSAVSSDKSSIRWIWDFLHKNTEGMKIYHLGRVTAWGRSNRHLFVCARNPDQLVLKIHQKLVTAALNVIG